MNDGIRTEKDNSGRVDELAKDIFEFREVCAKAKIMTKDKSAKMFGDVEEEEKCLESNSGGLIGELSNTISHAKSDILKVMNFIESL